jgi:hypothetical protein
MSEYVLFNNTTPYFESNQNQVVTNYCSGPATLYPTTFVLQPNVGRILISQSVKVNFPTPSYALVLNTMNFSYTTASTLTSGDTLQIQVNYTAPNGVSDVLYPFISNVPITNSPLNFKQSIQNINNSNTTITSGTYTFDTYISYLTTGTTPITLAITNIGGNNGSAIIPLNYIT